MKVLVFTSLYPNNIWPNHGVFVKERMTHFSRLDDCSVKVIAPVPYFPPLKLGQRYLFSQIVRRELRDGIEVHHPKFFMIPKVGMFLYGLMMFLSVFPAVRKVQRSFDFDVIDAHYVYPDGFAAVLLGRFFRKPVIVSARGSDINLYGTLPVIRRLLRYTLIKADKVIAVCQALKDAMIAMEIPGQKISVIPNGVDHKKFFPSSKEEARKKLDLPLDRKVILSVGALIPRKGFNLLIKAHKIIVDEGSEKCPILVIVGEGPSRPELEQLISSLNLTRYVRLLGSIPHNALYLWYNAADLFCLASSREGWPNVLMESLACGTPVVATSVWGTPEVIRSDKIGFLAERSEKSFAGKISIALNKTWQFETIIQYAKDHTWYEVAQSVHDVFNSSLDKCGKRPCGEVPNQKKNSILPEKHNTTF